MQGYINTSNEHITSANLIYIALIYLLRQKFDKKSNQYHGETKISQKNQQEQNKNNSLSGFQIKKLDQKRLILWWKEKRTEW